MSRWLIERALYCLFLCDTWSPLPSLDMPSSLVRCRCRPSRSKTFFLSWQFFYRRHPCESSPGFFYSPAASPPPHHFGDYNAGMVLSYHDCTSHEDIPTKATFIHCEPAAPCRPRSRNTLSDRLGGFSCYILFCVPWARQHPTPSILG